MISHLIFMCNGQLWSRSGCDEWAYKGTGCKIAKEANARNCLLDVAYFLNTISVVALVFQVKLVEK